jgi:transposase
MKVTTVGLDLAKSVLQAHAVNVSGHRVFNRQLRRNQVIEFFARLEPCVIAMEACSGAHHWARRLQALGHQVRLIAPQYVKAFVKTNKNDAADAEAICIAARQPDMRFVSPKNPEQQGVMALHALRAGAMKTRNAQASRLRGLLAEFGIVIPQSIAQVYKRVPEALEDATNEIPAFMRVALQAEYDQLKLQEQHLQAVHSMIQRWHRDCAASRAVERIPGVGVLSATALVASMGEASSYTNGRQVSAWAGIVPKQHSSGGKQRLLGISKRGDAYLRTLLIHGARSVISALKRRLKTGLDPALFSRTERWLLALVNRRNANVAAVALANKNVRTAWAMLAHGKPYETDHVSISPRAAAVLPA